jgi:hypothetical protein
MAELTSTIVTAVAVGAAAILFTAIFLVWSGLASVESHFGRGAFASVAFGAFLVWAVSQFDPAGLGAALVISAAFIVIVGIYGLLRDAIAWFRGDHARPKGPFET